jgi:hypothetical protein
MNQFNSKKFLGHFARDFLFLRIDLMKFMMNYGRLEAAGTRFGIAA